MSKKRPSQSITPGDGSRCRRRLRSQGAPPLPPLRRSPRFHHHQQQKAAATAAVGVLDGKTLSKSEHNEGGRKNKNINPEKCSPSFEEVSSACINRRPLTPITAPENRRRSPRLASHYVEQVARQREEASLLASAPTLKAEEECGKTKRTEVTVKNPESLRRSARLASHHAERLEKNGEERSYLELEVIENEEEDQRACTRTTEDGVGEEGNERQSCFAVSSKGNWTKDEEAALRKAYLLAKPSPHFWKKVSKMVPGKSAQECFNKMHADLATPPQPQPRSRAKKIDISPVSSFHFSDDSVDTVKQKVKRVRNSKHKSLAAHKTVRQLLRKHQLVDQAQETDLFSVLETSSNSLKLSDTSPSQTPGRMLKSSCFLVKCNEKSSSAHNRLMVSQASEPSPEVLKRIKNIPLHEKYIDHLLSRESRRAGLPEKRSSLAAAGTQINAPKVDTVEAAKASLISEARETIRQFQHLQANILEDDNASDTDIVNDNSDCYDEEDHV